MSQEIHGSTGQNLNAGSAVKEDPPANDNSLKLASTGWVRSAMATIAVAAGFAFSFASDGYLKLPSWLGGITFQWGLFVATAGAVNVAGTGWVNFPIVFPNKCLHVALQQQSVDNVLCQYAAGPHPTDAGRFAWAFLSASAGLTRQVRYLAIGY